VGVINKFITILLNVFIWDKHASPLGILALVLCLVGGSFYQQAPMRAVDKPLGVDVFSKLGKQMEAEEYAEGGGKDVGAIEAVPLIMSTEGGRKGGGGEKQVPVGAV